MKKLPKTLYGPAHPTFAVIDLVEKAILKKIGGMPELERQLPLLFRECIDDAIDVPGMERFFLDDLMPQEKANIGTRVEIALRDLLEFPKGKLDFVIAKTDVDVKFTMSGNWMIPTEAINEVCILTAADEDRSRCYFGLIKADPAYLTKAGNKDKKVSVSALGFASINWLIADRPYPKSFWATISHKQRETIFSHRGGTSRLVTLFEMFQQVPIHRSVIEGIARQKDNMKRVRKNGGARDALHRKGILILSGAYDSAKIAQRGLPYCDRESFISTK